MSWRPAGWQNPYPKTIVDECSGIEVNSGKYPIFEAGADAMLEALKKSSYPVRPFKKFPLEELRIIYAYSTDSDDEWGVTTDRNPPDAPWHTQTGYLVFIPIWQKNQRG